jgi:Fur family transcriptional regulator, iron response regulator
MSKSTTIRPSTTVPHQSDAVSNAMLVKDGPAKGITGNDILARLRAAKLRPTRQRCSLAALLFGRGDRHLSAETLHAEAAKSGVGVSLATVYNTLHQFQQAGLLRELAVDGQRSYFDTNTSNHNHFYIEARGELIDIPGDAVRVDGLPTPPEGMRISHVDVVVRLVKV